MKWYLQIHHTLWVLWGYSDQPSAVSVDKAEIDLGPELDFKLEFELPNPYRAGIIPRIYEVRRGYGWRWQTESGRGHDWKFATSVTECKDKAMASMVNQRFDTQAIFNEAIKDVRVS